MKNKVKKKVWGGRVGSVKGPGPDCERKASKRCGMIALGRFFIRVNNFVVILRLF